MSATAEWSRGLCRVESAPGRAAAPRRRLVAGPIRALPAAMHRIIAIALFALTFLAASPPAAVAQCDGFRWDNPSPSYPRGVSHHTWTSRAMGVDVGFNLYLPPDYAASDARYPVIYFLHGIGGDEGTMVTNVVTWMEQRVAAGLIRPAILVFPNGAVDSGYADAKDGSRRIWTLILDELIAHVDATWRTAACRGQRAISGFSMGGNGALLYALARPELFSSVVAYAPAIHDFASLRPTIKTCMFGDDAAYYERFRPETWARSNRDAIAGGLPIRIAVGDADPLHSSDVAFDQLLTSLAIDHVFESVPGCSHNHGCLWQTAGDRGVATHEAAFAACAATTTDGGVAPVGDAGTTTADAGASAASDGGGCQTSGRPGVGLLVACAIVALARRRRRTLALAATTAAALGCSADAGAPAGADASAVDASAVDASPSDSGSLDGPVAPGDAAAASVDCAALIINGAPTAASGATWSYQSTDDGVAYRLHGVVLAPTGAGPFPAALVSHGRGGSSTSYAAEIGRELRGWGMVVIAVDYTHQREPDTDLPTDAFGASPGNLARGRKALELLACLPSVDRTRLAAHGHSMGAMVTSGVLGTTAGIAAGSHTAGGFDASAAEAATPTRAMVDGIRTPYQLHHGTADTVVPIELDRALAAILATAGVTHELREYPGVDHRAIALDPTMLARVRAWYQAHGVLP